MWVHSPTSTLRPSRGSRHDAAGPSAKGRARQSTTRGRSGLRIALAASVPPDAGGHLFAQGPPARAARSPTGREKGGRKEGGGRPDRNRSACIRKKSRKDRMRKHIVRFRKNKTRKNHTRIPDDDGKNRLCEKPVFPVARHVPHPGSKPREIGGGFVWRRKYAAAIDRRTDCRGGGVPSLFAGSSYRTEKRKYIRKHTHLRVRRIGQNDRKPGDSAPPRRMPPKQPRTADGHSAVRCTDHPFWQARCGVRPNVRPARRASLGDKVPAGLSETVSGGPGHELEQSDDIAVASGMDMQGEQVAYLTGDLNAELWPEIHQFICCCSSI